jgi:hypothetical protein
MNSPNPNFVLNIIELQNVITNASGVDPVSYLSNQVVNLQEMVNYDLKQINVNAISNFNTTPIQVYSPLNLCNVALTLNDGVVSGGSSVISTIGTSSNASLIIGNVSTPFIFTQDLVSTFYITADSNATFTGTVSATNFITTSDARKKINVEKITDYETILSAVNGVRFQWKESTTDDIGVIAQDVIPVLPEAVYDTADGYKVAYQKFVPVLIEAVKALQKRVTAIENGMPVVYV